MSDYTKRLRPRVSTGSRKSLSVSRRLIPKVSKTNKEKRVRKRANQTTIPNKMVDIEIVPILTEPVPAFDVSISVDIPAGKPKRIKMRKKSKSEVHRLLRDAGVKDPEAVCLCLKAGISSGCVNFEVPKPLEQILLQSTCYSCENEIVVKVRDVLYQGPMGGSYWDGYDDDVICPNPECKKRFVVSDMCSINPELSSGKFYNHCEACPGFGRCIGDFRQSHCVSCGDHYFAGSMGQFNCQTCYSASEDDENDVGMLTAFFSDRPIPKNIPIFSYIYEKLETLRFDALRSDPELSESPAFHYILNDGSSSSSEID